MFGARMCPRLAETFLDGLIWRSHKTSHGMRPVIYYLEHLVKDMDESKTLSRALISFSVHQRCFVSWVFTWFLCVKTQLLGISWPLRLCEIQAPRHHHPSNPHLHSGFAVAATGDGILHLGPVDDHLQLRHFHLSWVLFEQPSLGDAGHHQTSAGGQIVGLHVWVGATFMVAHPADVQGHCQQRRSALPQVPRPHRGWLHHSQVPSAFHGNDWPAADHGYAWDAGLGTHDPLHFAWWDTASSLWGLDGAHELRLWTSFGARQGKKRTSHHGSKLGQWLRGFQHGIFQPGPFFYLFLGSNLTCDILRIPKPFQGSSSISSWSSNSVMSPLSSRNFECSACARPSRFYCVSGRSQWWSSASHWQSPHWPSQYPNLPTLKLSTNGKTWGLSSPHWCRWPWEWWIWRKFMAWWNTSLCSLWLCEKRLSYGG